MPTGTLIPTPYQTVLSATGDPVSGAQISFFLSGTSTPLTGSSDAALLVPLSNPVIADSAGRYVAYMSATSAKVVTKDAAGVLIRTVDPVTSTGSSGAGLVGAAIGDVFVFGGDPTSPVTAAAYPAGATFDKLHAGSSVMALDSANLAPGTYVLQVTGVVSAAATLTIGLVNLSDGAPDTPLAEATITSLTGANGTSPAITFAGSGASKNYGIKAKITANDGEAWGARIVRTA